MTVEKLFDNDCVIIVAKIVRKKEVDKSSKTPGRYKKKCL